MSMVYDYFRLYLIVMYYYIIIIIIDLDLPIGIFLRGEVTFLTGTGIDEDCSSLVNVPCLWISAIVPGFRFVLDLTGLLTTGIALVLPPPRILFTYNEKKLGKDYLQNNTKI